MSRFLKVVTLALLVFLAAGAVFAQSQPKAAWPAYAFSILLGFGTGQYYCGQNGTPFLVGDLIGVAGMVGGGIYTLASIDPLNPSATLSGAVTGYSIIVVGSLVYLVAHIWEIVDVFGAVDKAKKAGVVAELVPMMDIQRTSFGVGVSLRY